MGMVRKAVGALVAALREIVAAVWETNPLLASRDLLNRWGTYRLRRHPAQILFRIAFLGVLVWVIEKYGRLWVQPHLLAAAGGVSGNLLIREVLSRTATALFSSLNIISCLAIVAIWGDLRRMARDGHFESLQVVPGRLSAPALYYAIATRYLPLALVAVVLFALDSKSSPFARFPFEEEGMMQGFQLRQAPPEWAGFSPLEKLDIEKMTVPQNEKDMLDPWTVRWPLIMLGSMLVFCVLNFAMDTSIGFWVFCRFRVSVASLLVATAVACGLTPVFFMAASVLIRRRYYPVLNTTPQSLDYIMDTCYFLFSGVASLIVAVGLLTLAALRWRRLQSSVTEDPVLLQVRH